MAAPTALETLLRSLREAGRDASAEAGAFGRPSRAVACGWPTVDRALGADAGTPGLVRGGVHEWFGIGAPRGPRTDEWAPPLLVLAHVARRAVLDAVERGAPTTVVWIGRRVWPYPRALTGGVEVVEAPASKATGDAGELEVALTLRESPNAFAAEGGDLFARSLFVDPPDGSLRL